MTSLNPSSILKQYHTECLLAAASGMLLTCAYPKINQFWLAWFAFIPLLYAINRLTGKGVFYIGLFSGIIHYSTLLYWLVPTMHRYGGLPVWTGCLLLLLLASYLGLYFAGFSIFLKVFCNSPLKLLMGFPLVLVALEFIRSFLFSGFPWELTGYSQYQWLHLVQLSDITGVYGISFLIALSNASLFITLLSFRKQAWHIIDIPRKTAWRSLAIAGMTVILTLVYGTVRIQSVDREMQTADTARVSVIQGNINQAVKWNSDYQQSTILKYLELTFSTSADAPSLTVWPETATPFYFASPYASRYLKELIQEGVKTADTWLLFGSPSYKRNGETVNYYNSAYLLDPSGNRTGSYSKVHLVPYGEYVPLKQFFPFIGKLVEHVGDFKAGTKGSTIAWGSHQIGVQICFEIIFPELSAAMARNNASVLVNITNDAWFGTSSGPYQHFSMTVFRAVENKRALARSANTGISGFIDPVGRVVQQTPLSTEAAVTQAIPLMATRTIYTRFGDLFAKTCSVLVLIFMAGGYFQRSKRHSG